MSTDLIVIPGSFHPPVRYNDECMCIEPADTADDYTEAEILSTIENLSNPTLEQYEQEIQLGLNRGIEAAIKVGKAFCEIKKQKLFSKFASFNEYCLEKWGFGGAYAYRLIKVYKIHTCVISPSGEKSLPRLTSEAQYRVLGTLKDPDKQLKVLQHIAQQAPSKCPTAQDILDAAIDLGFKSPSKGNKSKTADAAYVKEKARDASSLIGRIRQLVPDFQTALADQSIEMWESITARLFEILEIKMD